MARGGRGPVGMLSEHRVSWRACPSMQWRPGRSLHASLCAGTNAPRCRLAAPPWPRPRIWGSTSWSARQSHSFPVCLPTMHPHVRVQGMDGPTGGRVHRLGQFGRGTSRCRAQHVFRRAHGGPDSGLALVPVPGQPPAAGCHGEGGVQDRRRSAENEHRGWLWFWFLGKGRGWL